MNNTYILLELNEVLEAKSYTLNDTIENYDKIGFIFRFQSTGNVYSIEYNRKLALDEGVPRMPYALLCLYDIYSIKDSYGYIDGKILTCLGSTNGEHVYLKYVYGIKHV